MQHPFIFSSDERLWPSYVRCHRVSVVCQSNWTYTSFHRNDPWIVHLQVVQRFKVDAELRKDLKTLKSSCQKPLARFGNDMAQMVMGEPSSTKIVQLILVNLKHGYQRAEFVLLYIYRET